MQAPPDQEPWATGFQGLGVGTGRCRRSVQAAAAGRGAARAEDRLLVGLQGELRQRQRGLGFRISFSLGETLIPINACQERIHGVSLFVQYTFSSDTLHGTAAGWLALGVQQHSCHV